MTERKITLEAARVNARLNQEEASEMLGISAVTLRSYEKGYTAPNWDTVQKMERLYNWPASQIFFGTKFALSETDSEPAE